MSGNSQKEIELRGTLTNNEFTIVTEKLNKLALKAEDDKLTYFFVTEGFILKVTDQMSKNSAKITLKLGDETMNVLDEYEIPIKRRSVSDAVNMFKYLGFNKVNPVKQIRTNYQYKSTEIALKYSDDWGYHFEIEKIPPVMENSESVKMYLVKICRELNLTPMSPEEIRNKITEINKFHGFIK